MSWGQGRDPRVTPCTQSGELWVWSVDATSCPPGAAQEHGVEGRRHLRVGLAVGQVGGGPELRTPGASLLEHLLCPLGHPGRALLHAAVLCHPVWVTEARMALEPGPSASPPRTSQGPQRHSQASARVQLGGGEGVLAGSPFLCRGRGPHALEHEWCPVLSRRRAARGQMRSVRSSLDKWFFFFFCPLSWALH